MNSEQRFLLDQCRTHNYHEKSHKTYQWYECYGRSDQIVRLYVCWRLFWLHFSVPGVPLCLL